MFIVTYRKIFYALSVLIFIASIGALSVWGLNLGIDFKGGSLMEVSFATSSPVTSAQIEGVIAPLNLESTVRTGGNGFLIRMKTLTETERQTVVSVLEKIDKGVTVNRFTSIGPVLGKEAASKSLWAIALVLVCIVFFVAFVFRKVSEPISSWKYGLITIVALAHDVLVPAGVFAYLGHFQGVQVDTLFVTALLVVLGFSVHDTIVVFDRVREHLKNQKENRINKTFEATVGESVAETFTRSINTSLTVLFALGVMYFIGGEATHYFTLALLVGIVSGTYSSIFLASPLLVTVQKWQDRKSK